jgi:hypothetical protein
MSKFAPIRHRKAPARRPAPTPVPPRQPAPPAPRPPAHR